MERVTDIRQLRAGDEITYARKIVWRRKATPKYYCPDTAGLYDQIPLRPLRRSTIKSIDRENNIVRVKLRRERDSANAVCAVAD